MPSEERNVFNVTYIYFFSFLCPLGFPELDQYQMERGQCGNKMAAHLVRHLGGGSQGLWLGDRQGQGGGRSLNPLQASDQYRESKMAAFQGTCPGILPDWL